MLKFDPLFLDGTSHNSIDKVSDDVYKHTEKFFMYLDPDYEMVGRGTMEVSSSEDGDDN